MKSPDPLDPVRLSIRDAACQRVFGTDERRIQIDLTVVYEPWWGDEGQDVLWEQSNAVTCLREALKRGGVEAE